MRSDREFVVVGGGIMGSATARELARRGRDVLLVERFAFGHDRGASHGSTRNLNPAYLEPHYLELFRDAVLGWQEWEAERGRPLIDRVGLIDHGPDIRHRELPGALAAHGIAVEPISPAEAEARWAGLRLDGEGLLFPDAGRIHAAEALGAAQSGARLHGAELVDHARVLSIVPDDDGVTIELEAADRRSIIRARQVVVTAGAWARRLIPAPWGLPSLRVTDEHPAFFRWSGAPDVPSVNHRRGTGPGYDDWHGPVYGVLSPEGFKLGWHAAGPEVDPDEARAVVDTAQLSALQRYVHEWVPGADAATAIDLSCTYTSTPTSDFVLDTRGRVTVGAGFSGHGFKFAPAIGRTLAESALGRRRPPLPFRAVSD